MQRVSDDEPAQRPKTTPSRVATALARGFAKGYAADQRYCRDCGTIARPRSHTPGSFLIELVLWLCLIVPGLIYSLWRLSARRKVCPACGSARIIPPDSPIARQERGD